jgi:hypothetical protein
MTTPLGSTLCIGLSFLLTQSEPLNQPVAGIFHEICAILRAEDWGKWRPQARFGFVEQHIWEISRATIPQLKAFGMR